MYRGGCRPPRPVGARGAGWVRGCIAVRCAPSSGALGDR